MLTLRIVRAVAAFTMLASSLVLAAQSPTPDEQSCRRFVQNFYDWYWNQFSDRADKPDFDPSHLHTPSDVLRRRPRILSKELTELIEKDQKNSVAKNEVGNLDFDIFLNSQDPEGKYRVTAVHAADGVCKAWLSRRHVVAELGKTASGWQFINVRYSYYSEDGKKKEFPDDDLIHILRR